jgi:tetratricopeptide (TPR) repeat protein
MAARTALAKRLGQHEEYVELLPAEANLKLDRPQQLLEYAIKLAPDQWRAHSALADIHSANEEYKLAAESYTRAIARGPRENEPYLRLATLYRAWGYEDEALAVANAWMKVRATDDDYAGIYELAAAAYEAKGDLKKAIEMLTIVLAHPARGADNAAYNRARLYVATKQWDKARMDLALFPTHNKAKMREVNALLAKIPVAKKKR